MTVAVFARLDDEIIVFEKCREFCYEVHNCSLYDVYTNTARETLSHYAFHAVNHR